MLKYDMARLWPVISTLKFSPFYFVKMPSGRAVYGGLVDSPDTMAQLVENANKVGASAYVHLNVVNPSALVAKASTQDIILWRNILVDIDPGPNGGFPLLAADGVHNYLFNRGWNGCITRLYSGRGVQLWLRVSGLDVLKDLNSHAAYRIEAAISTFLRSLQPLAQKYGCVVDTSCSDLARVARLPGNVNAKTGETATLGIVAYQSYDSLAFLSEYGPATRNEAPPRKLTGTFEFVKVLGHLTEKAATFLIEGVQEPGRHSAAFAASANLAELGVPRDEAYEWVIRGGMRCSPPLTVADTERAFNNAWRKHEDT